MLPNKPIKIAASFSTLGDKFADFWFVKEKPLDVQPVFDPFGAKVPFSRFENEKHTDIVRHYAYMRASVSKYRTFFHRPLSLTEKILISALDKSSAEQIYEQKQVAIRPTELLKLNPARVALQDDTAQMALLQFLASRLPRNSAVPATVHCDRLVPAGAAGAETDVSLAKQENKEVFDFLQTASKKLGIGFWPPGAGLMHQVLLENYAFPGALMLAADAHASNAGGLGMLALGAGGADAAEVLAGLPWEVACPRIVGVRLYGELRGWASPKDVILHLVGLLSDRGTGCPTVCAKVAGECEGECVCIYVRICVYVYMCAKEERLGVLARRACVSARGERRG